MTKKTPAAPKADATPPRETKIQRELRTAKMRAKALELRLAGASWQQVADGAGYASKGAAHNAVKFELDQIPRDNAKHLLEQELERLDRLQMAHWSAARGGDTFATTSILKIMDMRAKLLGLHEAKEQDGNLEAIKAALIGFKEGLVHVDFDDPSNFSSSAAAEVDESEAGPVGS